MTPTNETTNATTNATKTVKLTVFDLASFDDVQLQKTVTLPTKPTTIHEALAAVGNDQAALLDVIYDGLVERAVESARQDITGFQVEDEEGKLQPYTGSYADEEKTKLINGIVLAMAKLNGFSKDLSKDKKRELKENAKNFVRANPAVLGSIATQ